MVDICEKNGICDHWRRMNGYGTGGGYCCHYLLDTGRRRVGDADHCESKEIGQRKKEPSFDCPPEQWGL